MKEKATCCICKRNPIDQAESALFCPTCIKENRLKEPFEVKITNLHGGWNPKPFKPIALADDMVGVCEGIDFGEKEEPKKECDHIVGLDDGGFEYGWDVRRSSENETYKLREEDDYIFNYCPECGCSLQQEREAGGEKLSLK